MSSPSTSTATSSSSSSKIHSAKADNVYVQSVLKTDTESKVSIENSKKIKDLMARLGSTHLQVDEYSRKRTEEISEAAAELVKKVVAETQSQQQQLLSDANLRTNEIENDFKRKLQEHVAKLDSEKATSLAQLEKELDVRQELILESARKRIDDLDEEADRLKSDVLKEAKAQSSAQVTKITEKVAALEKEDASRRLASTTKTVITTKAEASDENKVKGSPVSTSKTTTEVEQSKSSSKTTTEVEKSKSSSSSPAASAESRRN